MSDPIEGRVAQLLNIRELVINRGKEHGVEVGMAFEILDQNGIDVEDPETGQVIGSVNLPKARVKVSHVEDKLCVARTYRKVRKNVGGSGALLTDFGGISRMMTPPKWIETTESLRTDEDISITEEQSKVKIRDLARQVVLGADE
jgi:hypothetical protein